MSNIDTSSWKEFKLGELFDIENTWVYGKNKQYKSQLKNPTNSSIAVVSGVTTNNGVNYYTEDILDDSEVYNDCLTISTRGEYSGSVFYHDYPFVLANNILVMPMPELSKESKLFIATVIQALPFGGYGNYPTKDKLKEAIIKLPVKESEEINWEYMQERISELEQERISELEQERISELEQYLIAAGLNDYELTDEDKEILATKLTDGGALQSSTSVNGCLKEARMFRVGDLFEKPDLKWKARRKFNKQKDISQIQTKEYNLPLVNAKNGSNGIMYYGRKDDFSYVKGGIDIVNDGAVSAGNVYPQPHEIGVLYNAYIIVLKNKKSNRLLDEYFACSLEKAIKEKFSYSNKAGWEKVKECIFTVPIQTDSQNNPIIDSTHMYHPYGYIPDWEYMEKYIKATEKVVIKNVVDWKDKEISLTKEVLNNGQRYY